MGQSIGSSRITAKILPLCEVFQSEKTVEYILV